MKIKSVIVLLGCLSTLMCATTEVQAATITSIGSGNWNSTTVNAPWPSGKTSPFVITIDQSNPPTFFRLYKP